MTKDELLIQLAKVTGNTEIVLKLYSPDRQAIYGAAPISKAIYVSLESDIFLTTMSDETIRAYIYTDKIIK